MDVLAGQGQDQQASAEDTDRHGGVAHGLTAIGSRRVNGVDTVKEKGGRIFFVVSCVLASHSDSSL